MNKILICLLGIIFAFIILGVHQYSTFYPYISGLRPQQFVHPDFIQFKPYIKQNIFQNAQIITYPNLTFPQDLDIDSQGNLYTGLNDGKIVMITKQKLIITLGKSQGEKIYGIKLSHDEKMIYFISDKEGLCSFDIKKKIIKSLFSNYKGQFLYSLNSLDLDIQGKIIYLTQTSTRIPMIYHQKQIHLKNPLGRIFSYNLKTNQVQLITDNLCFPNGIVYQPQEKSILVAQLVKYRILRIYIHGKEKGKIQVLVDNIPGFADNMKLNDEGDLWVGLPITRNEMTDYTDQNLILRTILVHLPFSLTSLIANKKYTGGIRIDRKSGKILQYFLGIHQSTNMITTILERKGKKYTASLVSPTILVIQNKK